MFKYMQAKKAAALQRRHKLQEKRGETRTGQKKKEQMMLDAQLAVAAARPAVLEGSVIRGKAHSDGINSYISKGHQETNLKVNPKVSECVQTATLDAGSVVLPTSSPTDVQP